LYSGPVQSVKEHKKVTDEIDDVYMAAVDAATGMQSYLVNRVGGNKREQFLSFYRSFYALFAHTRYMNDVCEDDVKDDKKQPYNLVNEIEGWFVDCKKPRFRNLPPAFIEDGVNLFSAYQKKLITKGVITITR